MKHYVIGNTNSTRIQFFRYLFVGGSSAVVHLTIYTICLWFFLGEEHYLIANVIAFMISVIWNYSLGVWWVFTSKRHPMAEFVMVITIASFGLLWNSLLLYWFVESLLWDPFWANIAAIWIVMFWNFGMRKWIVFE